MAISREFVTHLEDQFAVVPDTVIRRMFGGVGIFRHGLMYALVTSDGRIALKADDETAGEFQRAGAEEWVYQHKAGREMRMGYWYAPESILEDRDEFCQWALTAFEVAKRADGKKPASRRKYAPSAL